MSGEEQKDPYVVAREKLDSLLAVYAPFGAGRDAAIEAMKEGLKEFELAVRLHEREAVGHDRTKVEQDAREDERRVIGAEREKPQPIGTADQLPPGTVLARQGDQIVALDTTLPGTDENPDGGTIAMPADPVTPPAEPAPRSRRKTS